MKRNGKPARRMDRKSLFFRWFDRIRRDDPPSLFKAYCAGLAQGRRLQRKGD